MEESLLVNTAWGVIQNKKIFFLINPEFLFCFLLFLVFNKKRFKSKTKLGLFGINMF